VPTQAGGGAKGEGERGSQVDSVLNAEPDLRTLRSPPEPKSRVSCPAH